ncbi:MAG: DUF721 domain-containing protein [Sphaerochaetaceae bacterium]|jgi:hypothetical protein
MKEKTTQEVLALLLERLKINDSNALAKVYRHWEAIIGEDLALNSKLADLKRGVMVVEVTHPTYSSMVMIRRKEVLRRLNERFPELKITQVQVRCRS